MWRSTRKYGEKISEKDGERRGIGFVHSRGNQEFLPVATDIVGEEVLRGNRLPPVSLKQNSREAGFEAGPRCHRHGHQLSFCRQVEQLPTVLAPSRLLSSCARHLPLAVGSRKSRHVDLHPSRLIRGIRHPSAIGGKLCVPRRPLCLQQRLGYALRPGEVPQLNSLPDQCILAVA